MIELPTGRTFTNPLTSWRQDYIIGPLREGFDEYGFLPKALYPLAEEIHYERLKKGRTITAQTLEPVERYHIRLFSQLDRVKEMEPILTTPVSLDRSEEMPRRIIVDPFSDRDLMGYQQIEMFEDEGLADVDSKVFVFGRLGMVFILYHIVKPSPGSGELLHVFPETVKEENEFCYESGRRELGPWKRSKEWEFKPLFYKFYETFYKPALAKKWFPHIDDDTLEKYCLYNRYRLAEAFSAIIDNMLPEGREMVYYGKKGSFAYDVLDIISRKTGRKIKDLRVMRNVKSNRGECDQSAVNVLKGYIYQRWRMRKHELAKTLLEV